MIRSQSLFTDVQQEREPIEEKDDVVSSIAPSASSSLLTMALLSQSSHNDKTENEVMQACHFTASTNEILLDYLDGDVDTDEKEDEIKPLPIEERQQLTFLGKNIYELMAHRVAKLILSGEEEDVEEAVALVKKDPSILNYTVRVTAPNGRTAERKPLEIAAMAGDFDLREGLKEKNRGAVERLALAAELSKEEIDTQLEVITSEEAKKANEARNQRILDAVKVFGEGIIKFKKTIDDNNNEQKEISLKNFQVFCQPVINQLEKDLQPDPNEVITLGYIFDPKILDDAAIWFSENVARFSGWRSTQSNVFWINGIGKLQNHLSARDAQVTKAGIGYFVERRAFI